jgi:hypothetical protein
MQADTSTGPADLKPYPVFSQALSPISQTSADRIVDNVVRIVSVEGPMTGWRIHQVYKQCAPGRESHDEFSRLLNRAISAAERSQRIVAENPFNQTGNKPRTFRLPGQSAVARELGPRTVNIVPPAEVVQYCRKAAAGEVLSDEELINRVGSCWATATVSTCGMRSWPLSDLTRGLDSAVLCVLNPRHQL